LRPVHVEYLLMLIPTTSTLSLLIATKKHTCLQMTLELTFVKEMQLINFKIKSAFSEGWAIPLINKDTEALVCDLHVPKVNSKVICRQVCFLVAKYFPIFFYPLLWLAIFFETWWAIFELQPEEHCNLNWTTRHKKVLIALNIKQNLWPF
jgi:hypothetical protein